MTISSSTRSPHQITEYGPLTAPATPQTQNGVSQTIHSVATTALEPLYFSTCLRLSHFLNPQEKKTLSDVSPEFLITQANLDCPLKEICSPSQLINHLKQHGNKIHSLNLTGLDFSLAYELLTCCPKIEHLTLTSIMDDNIEQLLQLGDSLKTLSSLHLTHGSISDTGIKALVQSENLKSLTSLDLSNNNIGDDGIKALALSKNSKTLTSLDLSHNNIGPDGIKALA